MNNKIYNYLSLLFVILLSFGVVLPLFHAGFFPMHDDTQVARVFEMGKSLQAGMFPVRWVADLGYGYGYPIFNFYAPLAYYIGAVASLFTDALLATKIMIVLGIVVSGVTMYFFGKSLWGRLGGILSAVLYLYAPYHAVDLYVRGDIAELWSYAFFPLTLLGIWLLHKDRSAKSVLIGALGFAGVIVSHNLSAFLFAPFLFVLLFIVSISSKQKRQTAFYAVLMLVLGFLFSAWYVLPVFGEMKYTNVLSQIGGGANFRDHFVCLSQLWQSPWGYGGSVPGCVDGLSFMVGKLQIIFALLGLSSVFFLWKKFPGNASVLIASLICALVSVYLLLPYSQSLWETVPQMAFLQYPWRYLLLVSLFLAIMGGSSAFLLQKMPDFGKGIVIVLLSLLIAGFSLKYFQPQKFLDVESSSYTTKEQLTWTTSKLSDEYMPANLHKPERMHEIPSSLVIVNDGTSRVIASKPQENIVSVQAIKQTQVNINIAYFPTWQAKLDGQPVVLKPTSTGMSVIIPQGLHRLTISFKETPIELAGDWISLASVVIVILGILYARKKRL